MYNVLSEPFNPTRGLPETVTSAGGTALKVGVGIVAGLLGFGALRKGWRGMTRVGESMAAVGAGIKPAWGALERNTSALGKLVGVGQGWKGVGYRALGLGALGYGASYIDPFTPSAEAGTAWGAARSLAHLGVGALGYGAARGFMGRRAMLARGAERLAARVEDVATPRLARLRETERIARANELGSAQLTGITAGIARSARINVADFGLPNSRSIYRSVNSRFSPGAYEERFRQSSFETGLFKRLMERLE